MDEIIVSHAKSQKQQSQLVMIGSGGSAFDQVRKFSVHYISHEKLNKDQARVLFVNGVQDLLDMINKNEQIRPYLCHYPFTENNLNYRLAFRGKNEEPIFPPYVAYVFLSKGNIVFTQRDPGTGKYSGDDREEAYQEALRIINRSTSGNKQEYR